MAEEDPYLVGARNWVAGGGKATPAQPLDVPTKDDLRIAQLTRDLADLRREVEETDAVVASNAVAHNKLRAGVISGDIVLALSMLALAGWVVFGG